MKKAFTMIELIFVIVIIGILASIAIPKLAGTRDDAKISVMLQNIKILTNEITSYVLATTDVDTDFGVMSNTAKIMISSGDAEQVNEELLNIKMNTVPDCIKINIVSSSMDKKLTLGYGNANGDFMCEALQKNIDVDDYMVPLTGKRAQW